MFPTPENHVMSDKDQISCVLEPRDDLRDDAPAGPSARSSRSAPTTRDDSRVVAGIVAGFIVAASDHLYFSTRPGSCTSVASPTDGKRLI